MRSWFALCPLAFQSGNEAEKFGNGIGIVGLQVQIDLLPELKNPRGKFPLPHGKMRVLFGGHDWRFAGRKLLRKGRIFSLTIFFLSSPFSAFENSTTRRSRAVEVGRSINPSPCKLPA